MSTDTAAPVDLDTASPARVPSLRDRLDTLRDRLEPVRERLEPVRERLEPLRRRVVLPASQEGWMVLGGTVLALLGLLMAAVSWPSIVTDEFGSVVEGSAAWSAVGIAVAAIGGLICVAAAAAYGVLLGHEHAARVDDRD